MTDLFTPLRLGDLELPNRVVMAPLTRCRAGEGRVPTALMADYYVQRAAVGLILTEATSVDPTGVGYPDTPGIWSDAQVAGWKAITDAVHAAGGRIFCQLWHVGRISDPEHLGGALPVAPSAVKPAGHPSLLRPIRDYVTPRALDAAEIPAIVAAYAAGAKNARRAGFDGVELHAANGYLIEQFLADKTNLRTDSYGGSIPNRARLLFEVLDVLIAEWGASRVGVHLSPRFDANDSGTSDAAAVVEHVAHGLEARHVAFVFTREAEGADSLTPLIRSIYGGVVIGNEGFTKDTAEAAVAEGRVDAVAWGKAAIANPDLVERLKIDAPLNEVNFATVYGVGGNGPVGYTDYPTL